MDSYPEVLGELETLRLVCQGKSLARYGDGELKFCRGGAIKSQEWDRRLADRLRHILKDAGDCLIGIPNIRSDTPKAAHWGKYMRYAPYLSDDKRYVSAFVTRPDSAPWIDTPEYWDLFESLWVDQDVTLVRGSGKSLVAEDLAGASSVTEIMAPRQHAWVEYGDLVKKVLSVRPKRALICLGPTATVMAYDLCEKGIHAIDCGHFGMFRRKHLRGDPMWVTDADKVQPV